MGVKRPIDCEVPEFPFKHSKGSEKENIPHPSFGTLNGLTEKSVMSVWDEGDLDEFDWHIGQSKVSETEFSVSPEKDVGTSASLSWVTNGSSDEESGYDSLYPECFEFGFSRKRVQHSQEDIYSTLFNSPPNKEVLVGPDHQATLPDISYCTLESVGSEKKLMGTCVIPMRSPDFSSVDTGEAVGRTNCVCLEKGSVRCVRLHVMEAREKLRREFGGENFEKLGFCDMGEVVAARWSDEEEQIFHRVVFSNPQYLGRNFWKQLSVTFSSRSQKEIVSYYFNVFILRRRAAQNRLHFLDIDSDDDEWHGSCGNSHETEGAEVDEDSGIEFPTNLEDQTIFEATSPNEDFDDDSDDGNYPNNGWDGDFWNGVVVATEKDRGMVNPSDASNGMSSEKVRVNCIAQHVDNASGGFNDNFDFQDDSNTSFEFNMDDSCRTDDSRTGLQATGDKTYQTTSLSSRINELSDSANHTYMFDHCDTKLWDARYQSGPSKDVDLLPTSNIIEEIFGNGSWDSKWKDN